MYELEEHLPRVADQIDGLTRRVWNDYEAKLSREQRRRPRHSGSATE